MVVRGPTFQVGSQEPKLSVLKPGSPDETGMSSYVRVYLGDSNQGGAQGGLWEEDAALQ